MTTKSMPSFLQGKEPPPPDDDKLSVIRAKLAEARDLEMEVEKLTDRLTEAKRELNTLLTKTLPDMFQEARIRVLGLEAEGNIPEYVATLAPFYSAGIPASWDEAKRKKAFEWLDINGHGDLIKTQVEVAFPREKRDEANEAIAALNDLGFDPEVKESVHAATLTAWLREQVEDGSLPPLDVIGGVVGKTIKLKRKK